MQLGTHESAFIRIMLVNISPDISSRVRENATPAWAEAVTWNERVEYRARTFAKKMSSLPCSLRAWWQTSEIALSSAASA
jgi:hypothetical protein